MAKQPLVVIDNGVIDSLLADPRIASQIPCLANPPAAKRVSSCGGCGGGVQSVDYGAIKTCLALLDSAGLRQVKSFLGAGQVRVYRSTKNSAGKTVTVKHTR